MIDVTRNKSRQFNSSLHAKINYIEFEDKFMIKTHANVRLLKEFSNNQQKKRMEH